MVQGFLRKFAQWTEQ